MKLGVIALADAPSNTRRGGDVRALLSPRTVGATSGFMGAATIAPGDYVSSHRHPYSEEFVYLVRGEIEVQTDDASARLTPDHGVMIPRETPHRLVNVGPEPAFVVFHLSPLAPRPELGHVDLEVHDATAPPGPSPAVRP